LYDIILEESDAAEAQFQTALNDGNHEEEEDDDDMGCRQ